MPGIRYWDAQGTSNPPYSQEFLLGISQSVYGEDLVALTTNATYQIGTGAVLRDLLAADKTAHYKQGTPVAGVLGIAWNDVTTGTGGYATSAPLKGGAPAGAAITAALPTYSSGVPLDPVTGAGRMNVILAHPANLFSGVVDLNGTDFTANSGAVTVGHQWDNTLAGFVLSGTNPTTYRLQIGTGSAGVVGGQGAAVADSPIVIVGPDETDPLYNTVLTAAGSVGAGTAGPRLIFRFLPAFCQVLTGVVYSSQ